MALLVIKKLAQMQTAGTDLRGILFVKGGNFKGSPLNKVAPFSGDLGLTWDIGGAL